MSDSLSDLQVELNFSSAKFWPLHLSFRRPFQKFARRSGKVLAGPSAISISVRLIQPSIKSVAIRCGPLKGVPMKTKIFIVDDHPIVREGLAQLINQEEDLIVAGEAVHDGSGRGGSLVPAIPTLEQRARGNRGGLDPRTLGADKPVRPATPIRYSRQAASVENFRRNSRMSFGYSGRPMPA